MDDKIYEELLDKAYSELPEVLYKKGRFELPTVKGKLIKSRTVITNFKEISSKFSRDDEHLVKYFLKEAGVRGDLDSRGELVLHSRFQPAGLNKIVSKYFDNFVECPHCRSPDTVLENEGSMLVCKACGHQEKKSRL